MKTEDIVYKQRVGGYVYIYDNNGIIHVYDNDNVEDKNTQCLYSVQNKCNSKKEFELEIIYIHANRLNTIDELSESD